MSPNDSENFEVDEEGFVELGAYDREWHGLQAMKAERARLDAGIEKAEKFFKEKMITAKATGLKIGGVRVVTYRQDATFPAAKYALHNPIVAASYTVMKPVFDVAKFKEERPFEYEAWRGHSLRYVQPKKGS